jgi:hypothetical protein
MTMTEKSRMIDGVELTPKTVASIGRPTYATLEEERQARKIGLAAATSPRATPNSPTTSG